MPAITYANDEGEYVIVGRNSDDPADSESAFTLRAAGVLITHFDACRITDTGHAATVQIDANLNDARTRSDAEVAANKIATLAHSHGLSELNPVVATFDAALTELRAAVNT